MDRMKLIMAHRGAMHDYPENTMLAYRQGVLQGAGSIECDVRFSSDGVPIMMHDTTVTRTTNGTGNVVDLTAEQLTALDAGYNFQSGLYAGRDDTKVPKLEDVLDEFDGESVFLHLHLLTAGTAATKTHYEVVYEMVRQRGMLNQVIFFGGTVRRQMRMNPRILAVNSLEPSIDEYMPYLYDAVLYNLPIVEFDDDGTMTKAVADHVHSLGKAVQIMITSTDLAVQAATARSYMDMGVDVIGCNRPSILVDLFAADGITQSKPASAITWRKSYTFI